MAGGLRDRLKGVSIGVRLAVMLVTLLTVVLAVVGVGSILLQRRQATASVRHETQRLIESLEGSLRVQMLQGDSQLGDAVRRITRSGGVDQVTVTNHRGEIRHASEPSLIGRRLGLTDVRCALCHVGGKKVARPAVSPGVRVQVHPAREYTTAVLPIYTAPACYEAACHAHPKSQRVLGVLALEVPYHESARGIRTFQRWLILLSVSVIVILFVGVVLLIRRWVSRPVDVLVQGTRTVAEGDLSHEIPEGVAELGELARSFNLMQQKLRSSQQQLMVQEMLASMGRLAAGVAHEINNPLTGVLTFAEDLYEESDESDPRRADYEIILKETLRCREIVKNLLDFGRREGPRMQKLRLSDVVARPIRLVRKHPDFQNVEIVVDLDPRLPTVRGDASQLQQVFLNLLINAAQAMPNGGRLSIGGRYDEGAGVIRLEFVDTGVGVAAEILDKIFDPFFSTKEGQGSGIGLAVCSGIVEQHGGRIEVDSVEGQGSTFRIALPASAPDADRDHSDGKGRQ
ncbi:MAG: ATP-binding protein [bacterium]